MIELASSSQPLSPDVSSLPSNRQQRDDANNEENVTQQTTLRRRRQRRRISTTRFSYLMLSMILLLSTHYLQPISRFTAFAEDGAGNDDQAANNNNNNDATADEAEDAQADSSSSSSSSSSSNSGKTDDAGYGYGDDTYRTAKVDAEQFNWANGQGFGSISIMPISCINFNNGHMIKFELFESDASYQCHFAKIGTWVVSIAHFMRAYFNHQALVHGRDFKLPGDAGYLNCIMLQEMAYSVSPLYAKIGCVERETFTSTRLQLHVYQDSQCSKPYDDGRSNKYHALRGYDINGYTFSTRVSFRPPFYSCEACTAEEISSTFNKKYGTWYDDDYISQNGKSSSSSSSNKNNNDNGNNNDNNNNGNNNDQNNNSGSSNQATDDYYRDEKYLAANDDVNNKNGNSNNNNNNKNDDGGKNKKNNGYSFNDDYFNDDSRRQLKVVESRQVSAKPGLLEAYHDRFWQEYDKLHRKLYDNAYDAGDWNFCQRLYKYGVWCDRECRSLDVFRNDKWSKPDILLLVIMCTFFTAMLLLIVAKRLKAAEKARMYGHEHPLPGLPPLAMGVIFLVATAVIGALAEFKFVNETLVFAVVICILVFIYMLRLTLFEPRRPVLLATPQHEMFDNPLDDKLFD